MKKTGTPHTTPSSASHRLNWIILGVICFGIASYSLYSGYIFLPGQRPGPGERGCTMEAKLCPDGSSVGRSGPDCQFAACPLQTTVQTDSWELFESPAHDYSYRHPAGLKYDTGAGGSDYPSSRFTFIGPEQIKSGRTQTELFDGYAFSVINWGSSVQNVPEKMIREQHANASENCKTLSDISTVTVSGKTGYQYSGDCYSTSTLTVVSDGTHTYMITQIYMGKDGAADKKITDAIFSSFRFTGK
jgi:hypothetical protein